MTGQISTLPIELVAVIVAASMVVGAVDIIRQPGWAWKRAEESKPAYLILDLLLPVIGLSMYAFRARPKVTAAVGAGAAPTLVVDPWPMTEPEPERTEKTERTAPAAVAVETNPFTGFRELAGNGHGPAGTGPIPSGREQFEVSSTFFSTGSSTRTMRHPLALARAYRPKQRTSLVESDEPQPERESAPEPVSVPEPASAQVPEPVQAEVPESIQAEASESIQAEASEPVRAEASEPVRAQVAEPVPVPVVEAELRRVPVVAHDAPTVPSGWKADPTGRHQFRYWDGSHWTENVADDGEESRDEVSA
jgi:hypothetical protein